MNIYEATEYSDRLKTGFDRLIPQLSSSNPAPSAEALIEMVNSDASRLLMAEQDGEIIGSMTLVLFRIPTGVRAWVEDVVVDSTARGGGVGAALIEASIELARSEGATTVDLTSRPTREAANRLYKRLGFVQRETNVYRFAV